MKTFIDFEKALSIATVEAQDLFSVE